MDREKLNKAAEEARITTAISARSDWHHSLDGVNLDVSIDELVESFFVGGADWLMQQPLSERLTDEEKEKLTPANRYILGTIFGADLFQNK